MLDFETTGTLPGYPCEPWQIGLVMLQPARPIQPEHCVESLLRIGDRPFNPMAPGNHHALRGPLRIAPTFQDLWPSLRPLLQGVVLCAHNIATEKNMLRQLAPLHAFGPWIDTLRLTRTLWPDAPSHKLEDLVPALNLTPEARRVCPGRSPHDALYDAVCCALLLQTMMALPTWRDLPLETWIRLGSGRSDLSGVNVQ